MYGLLLFTGPFALGVFNNRILALFQEVIPDEKKGRFFTLLQGMIGVCLPAAYFVFGLVLETIGVKEVAILQGVAVVLFSLYYMQYVRIDDQFVTSGEMS